jgi:hypothetical protein
MQNGVASRAYLNGVHNNARPLKGEADFLRRRGRAGIFTVRDDDDALSQFQKIRPVLS